MKKYLIKSPGKAFEQVYSFPLVYSIFSSGCEVELTVIFEEGSENYYEHLPFDISFKFVPDDKNSILGYHKYKHQLLYELRPDVYLDLKGDFKSAALGFMFNSKKRLGFAKGLGNFLYSKGHRKAGEYDSIDRKFFSLLKSISKDALDPLLEVPEASFKKEDELKLETFGNFVVVSINDDKLERHTDFWKELLATLTRDYKVIAYQPNKDIDTLTLLGPFKETGNLLVMQEYSKELTQLILLKSKGLITDEPALAGLSSYLGLETFALVNNMAEYPKSEFFKVKPHIITAKDGKVEKLISLSEQLELESVDALIDKIYNYLNI